MSARLGERPHVDRLVSEATCRGRAVVVKRYEHIDPAPVFDAMVSLWHSPLGAIRRPPGLPEPISCWAGHLTMAYVPGPTLARRGDLGSTLDRLDEIALLLADLHGSGVTVARQRHTSKLVRSLKRKGEDLPIALSDQFARAVAAVTRAAPAAEDLVLTHGDFSPRNVLDSPPGLVLIDFDRLQMAGRGRDVAYVGAWIWATLLLAGETPTWEPADAFGALYASAAGGTAAETNRSLPFHRGAALLRIAQSWSALRDRVELSQRIISEAAMVSES